MSDGAEDRVASEDYTKGKDVDLYKPLIEAFWGFLVDRLRISHLLLDLHLEEVQKQLPRLHSLENSDPPRAAQELLEAIIRSPEPQKWNMFFGALRQDGATLILDTLLEESPADDGASSFTSINEHGLQLIKIYQEKVEKRLKLTSILPAAVQKGLIYPEDKDQLEELWRMDRVRAVGTFLLKVHRHKKNWYEILITLIYNKDAELAKEIDEEFCSKLEKRLRDEEPQAVRTAEVTGIVGEPDNASDFDRPHTAEVIGPGLEGDSTERISQPAVSTAGHSQPPRQGSEQLEGRTAPSGETTSSVCNCGRVSAELSALRSDMNEVKSMLRTLIHKPAGEGSTA